MPVLYGYVFGVRFGEHSPIALNERVKSRPGSLRRGFEGLQPSLVTKRCI